MGEHVLWKDMDFGKICPTARHVLLEVKSKWRTCPTEEHVLQVDYGLGPTHKYFTNY